MSGGGAGLCLWRKICHLLQHQEAQIGMSETRDVILT